MTSGEKPEMNPSKQYGQIIAKAWADPAFKARLLAEPEQAIRDQGVVLSAGQRLTAVEVQPSELYIVLAPKTAQPVTEADDPWATVWQRVAADGDYRERLLREPEAALAEEGIAPPPGLALRAVEANDAQGYLFVPPKPAGLDDTDTDDVAGYFSCCTPPAPSGNPFAGLPPGLFGGGFPGNSPVPNSVPTVSYVSMPSRTALGWPPR